MAEPRYLAECLSRFRRDRFWEAPTYVFKLLVKVFKALARQKW